MTMQSIFTTEEYFNDQRRPAADDGGDPGDNSPAPSPVADSSQLTPPDAPTPLSNPLLSASAPDPTQSEPSQSPSAATPQAPINTGQPSFWKTVAASALAGLTGAGAPNFAAGVGAGARAYNAQQQQKVDNQNQAQLLQFESLKSAHATVLAANEARAADNANEKAKLEISAMHDAAEEHAEELGFPPKVVISSDQTSDFHAQSAGALNTLAQQNPSGKVPQITTTNDPAGKDPTHNLNVYSISPTDVQNNETNALKLINQARSVQMPGSSPMDSSDLQKAGAAKSPGNWREGAAELANDSMSFLYRTPAVSSKNYKSGEGASENAAILATLNQQATNYAKQPNADPQVQNFLQNKINIFKALSDDALTKFSQGQSATISGTAGAEANAAQQKSAAEQDTPQGRATLAKTVQEKITSQNTNADKGIQQMWANGTNPATGEKLSLANAPDEMLVDQKTGLPIPTKMLATLKPTQTESNRADFARSVLHSLDNLDALEAAGKLPNGPMKGMTGAQLSKAGLGTKDVQTALNDISFVQSAATGAHVGGRFSLPVMDKMNAMIGLNMNSDQFNGAKESIRDVMKQYATQGGRMTVAEYKANQAASSGSQIPQGATMKVPGSDGKLYWSDGKNNLGVAQ
jgi:hypothetical protein